MSNRLTEPTRVIIPVDMAINRTKNWRDFVTNVLQIKDARKLPKGVYISKTDIEDLAAYCKADPTIAGVRTYFTLENGQEEVIKNEIKFIMVLVRESETHPFGEDLLYVPDSLKNMSNTDTIDDSNVFDFTRPCPDCCDPTSPLFNS
ncbi:hypothetical protein SAMN05421813_10326 [Daejeonella rubra]|uniref:Uncharacterized protein n=1 Tax=Daejeonella rubra TaxID=990371 RepID=A0A1G9NGT6_9SPHI|nr:hypothetical protein [Daejeonella rubra]SDL85591.1 hypothetical protein SAMN05421813_10326 [Daejeonella rubra]